MTGKILRFSRDWSKLSHPLFTTIRRRKLLEVGETVKVVSPSNEFEAIVLSCLKTPLCMVNNELLKWDTDSRTVKEALEKLQSFYRNQLRPTENLYIYFLLRKEADSSS